jgi:hypothetical protein
LCQAALLLGNEEKGEQIQMVKRGRFEERIVVRGGRLAHQLCQFGIARKESSLFSNSYSDRSILA